MKFIWHELRVHKWFSRSCKNKTDHGELRVTLEGLRMSLNSTNHP